MNVINQLVIGAKEGVTKAITKLIGNDVTNAILQMVNSSNHKSINEYTLYKLMKVAINDAYQSSMDDVLEQLIKKVINHNFDFQKTIQTDESGHQRCLPIIHGQRVGAADQGD
jgi:hypothetical protein